jgi:hypothetical protein
LSVLHGAWRDPIRDVDLATRFEQEIPEKSGHVFLCFLCFLLFNSPLAGSLLARIQSADAIPAKAPDEQVVELAKLTHADLIAIGVPHDRSLADALRGSTAERIVQQSGWPVLAVNAFAAAAERRAIVQEEKTAQIW